LDKHDFDAAEADVTTAETIDPTASSIPEARALIATRRSDWPRVIEAATKALAIDPKNKFALQNRSWAYVQKKDYAAAEKDLAALEAIDPTNAALIATRAAIADRKGDLQTALAGYSKALERNPGDTFARYQRGMLLYRDWKYEEAIRDYSEILRNDPKNVEVLGSRALAYVYKGDYAAAEADVVSGLNLSPNNSGLLFAKAKLDQHRGSSDEEIESYSKLIESSRDKGYAYLQRASAYLALNRYDLALADTEQALKLGYTTPDLRIVRANIFLLRNQRDAAASEAEAMIKNNPDSYAFVAAGKTYAALGQRDKAMQAFARALAIKPEGYVYANRAQVRLKSDIAGRAADIDAALKLDPDNTDLLKEKAQFLESRGDYVGAVATIDHVLTTNRQADTYVLRAYAHRRADQAAIFADLETALKLEPNNVNALFSKASTLLSHGRPEEAAKLFQQLETLRPQNKYYYSVGRAVALSKAGKTAQASALFGTLRKEAKTAAEFNSLCWEKATAAIMLESALEDCRQALKLSPDSGQYIDSLGMALLKLGKLDEALDAYNKAVSKDTGAASLMGRAVVYLRKGDRAHAEADAAGARKLYADIEDQFADYGLKFDDEPANAAAAATKPTAPGKN
jgi:tetratricopeptide (TPR) repeat protein